MPAKDLAADRVPHRWTLARSGYLLVPLVGVWFAAALVVPSPVGVLVPAIPYLALSLAATALLLVYGLWRSGRPRWSKAHRNTVVVGAVLGVTVAGLLGLAGGSVLACPYLPPASSLTPTYEGWSTVPTSAWKDGGLPVLFFLAATWCPYCSASSWAVWKALTGFGTVSGNFTSYSFGSPEPFAYTPEMVLASAHLSSGMIALEVSEYNGTVDGHPPSTANCHQQAYVAAYDACLGCGVPFLVIDGQWIHLGSLYSPAGLSAWNRTNDPAGAAFVESSVSSESGVPWQVVQGQTWWIMAFLTKATGLPVPALAMSYHWSRNTTANVSQDLEELG